MCVKNYNVNTIFIGENDSFLNGNATIGELSNTINVLRDGEVSKKHIEKLNFITFVNGISCNEDENLEKVYDFLWTLSPNSKSNTQIILAQNTFDPKPVKIDKNTGAISRYTANKIYGFSAQDLELDDEIGDTCVFKVFMREHTEDDSNVWEVQTIDVLGVKSILK